MATGRLVGTDTEHTANLAADYAIYTKFTASATGKVSEFRIHTHVAGNAKIAIYADSSSYPGSRLAYNNTGQACSVGWNTLTIPELDVVAGTVYWLAFVVSVTGVVVGGGDGTGTRRYVASTYSSHTWPATAPGSMTSQTREASIAAWGVLVITPSGISQPVSLGAPQLNLKIALSGISQALAYGTPAVTTAGLFIYPTGIVQPIGIGAPAILCPQTLLPSSITQAIAYGTPKLILFIKPSSIIQPVSYGTPKLILTIKPSSIAQAIAYGTPSLKYPQTILPQSIVVPILYGTPSVVGYGLIRPVGIAQLVAIGSPTLLKYVWHVILDGQYATETPQVNRAYVIGTDADGNPVYGTAITQSEIDLVGERLDFTPDPAIPTTAQVGDVAAAILAKMRLSGKGGVILIPPNCGQELFDVVQISDAGANQSAVKFRVVGIRFEYNPKQARYEHKLILGAS